MVDRLVHSEINSRRIMQVEQCFGSSGQPLAMPDRVLVGEGILTKMCRKKPKPRQFFLFNDILVYGNIVINKKKYNKQHIIPLETVKLQSIQDDGYFRNGWQIISPSKSFSVYAASSTEKSEWMAHINRCVQDLLTKQGKQRSDVEDSPVWVPDSDARVCMNCHKSEFTVLNRKHHCRKCGAVVCGPCSNQKWLLAEQASKPLRVCLNCYEKLSQQAAGGGGEVDAGVRGTGNNGNLDSSGDSSDDENEADGLATSDQPTFYGGSATKN